MTIIVDAVFGLLIVLLLLILVFQLNALLTTLGKIPSAASDYIEDPTIPERAADPYPTVDFPVFTEKDVRMHYELIMQYRDELECYRMCFAAYGSMKKINTSDIDIMRLRNARRHFAEISVWLGNCYTASELMTEANIRARKGGQSIRSIRSELSLPNVRWSGEGENHEVEEFLRKWGNKMGAAPISKVDPAAMEALLKEANSKLNYVEEKYHPFHSDKDGPSQIESDGYFLLA